MLCIDRAHLCILEGYTPSFHPWVHSWVVRFRFLLSNWRYMCILVTKHCICQLMASYQPGMSAEIFVKSGVHMACGLGVVDCVVFTVVTEDNSYLLQFWRWVCLCACAVQVQGGLWLEFPIIVMLPIRGTMAHIWKRSSQKWKCMWHYIHSLMLCLCCIF